MHFTGQEKKASSSKEFPDPLKTNFTPGEGVKTLRSKRKASHARVLEVEPKRKYEFHLFLPSTLGENGSDSQIRVSTGNLVSLGLEDNSGKQWVAEGKATSE